MASSFSGKVPLKETVAMERCIFRLPVIARFFRRSCRRLGPRSDDLLILFLKDKIKRSQPRFTRQLLRSSYARNACGARVVLGINYWLHDPVQQFKVYYLVSFMGDYRTQWPLAN